MSFRDNLQHLRATRNMTQEQLAMLLGVSRQSVTKWEAEKSTPEMDKLIKMCQLFDCTLDELVTGDLTGRVSETAQVTVSAGPPQDICGYDEHQRTFARQISNGVALILLGVALGFFFVNETFTGLEDGTLFAIIVLVGVVAGLMVIIPAGMEHGAFMRAHPYIEDFYTEADRATERGRFGRALPAGIALILIGVAALMVLGEARRTEHIGLCLLMLFIAAGVWLIVRYGMLYGRMNVAEYNKSVADELEAEEIAVAQIDDALREELLAKKKENKQLNAICGVIMIIATIVGLYLLFAPVFAAPTPDLFAPEGTSAMWFWVAWPVGGMLCGIVALIWNAFRRDA